MTARPSISDPAEFLHEQLAQASPDLLRELLEGSLNALLSADADRVCGAGPGQPRRNGYRPREFDTRAGTLELAVSKLREGSYSPEWLLAKRRRAEAALTSVVATCYRARLATRRGSRQRRSRTNWASVPSWAGAARRPRITSRG